LTTSPQKRPEAAMIQPTSNASANPVTHARPFKNSGLCVECGEVVVAPPGRGRPPALCHKCRIKTCSYCGMVFFRQFRSDAAKDAGKYCSRGCAFAARRSQDLKG
jgi:hypothetical protein